MPVFAAAQSYTAAYRYNPLGGLITPDPLSDEPLVLNAKTAPHIRAKVIPTTFHMAGVILTNQDVVFTERGLKNNGHGFVLDPRFTQLDQIVENRTVSRANFFVEQRASVLIEQDARYVPQNLVPNFDNLNQVDDKLLIKVKQGGRDGTRYQLIRMNGEVLVASGRRLVTDKEYVERILRSLDLTFSDSVEFVQLLLSALEAVAGIDRGIHLDDMLIKEGIGKHAETVADGSRGKVDHDQLRLFMDKEAPGELHIKVSDGETEFTAVISQGKQTKTKIPLIFIDYERTGPSIEPKPLPEILHAISNKIGGGLADPKHPK